jgi:tetratricopeptide (TPR) repeat protein
MRLSNPPEESEWIEAYLNDRLNSSEKAEFEAKLALNPELREEVELRRLMFDVIDEYNLRAEIAAVHAEKMGEPEWAQAEWADEDELLQDSPEPLIIPLPVHRPPAKPVWWRRAAAIAAAAGGLWMGYLAFDPITPHESATHITRGGQQPSSFCYTNYYTGKAYLNSRQPEKAIPCLEQVMNCEIRPYFKDASKWFLAVAYLQSGQTKRAEQIYDEIKQSPDFQYPIGAVDRWKMDWQLRVARVWP